MLATTTCSKSTEPTINDTVHRIDAALTTTSEDELKVWGYVMTQYNLKPGLRKFGQRGQTAAVKELTQLHIMDTWTPLQAEKISREQRMRALLSLLFLKENRGRKGTGVHKRSTTESLHPKGRCGITNCVDEVDIHHGSNSGSRA